MTTIDWRWLAAPLAAAACSSAPADDSATANAPVPKNPEQVAPASASFSNEEAPAKGEAPAQGVANLPYARGAVFASLDDYLVYLEKQGAIDLPWWRQVSPGVYERVVRMPEAEREVKTRAELMELYGFAR